MSALGAYEAVVEQSGPTLELVDEANKVKIEKEMAFLARFCEEAAMIEVPLADKPRTLAGPWQLQIEEKKQPGITVRKSLSIRYRAPEERLCYTPMELAEQRIERPPSSGRRLTSREFISRLSKKYVKNMIWTLEHPGELGQCPGRWVVVANEKICCVAESREDAEAMAQGEGLSRRDIVVEFVDYPLRVY